ncbi:MAG TPA: hypothetical protein VFU32_11770 [Ktedonobacterales bacterium]|nr:hypothetical protein [Ktedonobacterales bacterium]
MKHLVQKMGIVGLLELLEGFLIVLGFLLPWKVITVVSVTSFEMSGFEMADYWGQGVFWFIPACALILMALVTLRARYAAVPPFVSHLFAILCGGVSVFIFFVAFDEWIIPPGFFTPTSGSVVGQGPAFGFLLTLLVLVIVSISGLAGLASEAWRAFRFHSQRRILDSKENIAAS